MLGFQTSLAIHKTSAIFSFLGQMESKLNKLNTKKVLKAREGCED
jgi:hypothetical protein